MDKSGIEYLRTKRREFAPVRRKVIRFASTCADEALPAAIQPTLRALLSYFPDGALKDNRTAGGALLEALQYFRSRGTVALTDPSLASSGTAEVRRLLRSTIAWQASSWEELIQAFAALKAHAILAD